MQKILCCKFPSVWIITVLFILLYMLNIALPSYPDGFWHPGSFQGNYISVGGFPFPADNIIAWYKDGTQIVDTSAGRNSVSKWPDSSGNQYDMVQPTKSKQPTYSSGYVVCDGSDDEMEMVSGKLGMLRNRAQIAMYMVLQADNDDQFVFWASNGTSTTNYRYAAQLITTNKIRQLQRRDDAGSGFAIAYTNTYTSNEDFLYTAFIDYTNNDGKVFKDGTLETDGAAGSTGATSDTDSQEINFCSSGGANYSNVTIKEVIFISSIDDQTEIDNYLIDKYSLGE